MALSAIISCSSQGQTRHVPADNKGRAAVGEMCILHQRQAVPTIARTTHMRADTGCTFPVLPDQQILKPCACCRFCCLHVQWTLCIAHNCRHSLAQHTLALYHPLTHLLMVSKAFAGAFGSSSMKSNTSLMSALGSAILPDLVGMPLIGASRRRTASIVCTVATCGAAIHADCYP